MEYFGEKWRVKSEKGGYGWNDEQKRRLWSYELKSGIFWWKVKGEKWKGGDGWNDERKRRLWFFE